MVDQTSALISDCYVYGLIDCQAAEGDMYVCMYVWVCVKSDAPFIVVVPFFIEYEVLYTCMYVRVRVWCNGYKAEQRRVVLGEF